MRARIRQFYQTLRDSFWLIPALFLLAGLAGAEMLLSLERRALIDGDFAGWVYSGGETGARTLLGAVAGSTIAVAGTLFSITIATLTLASNQMGPRLLSNFTRDRGNQVILGVYLGTFVYALMVLRSVRGADQGAFIPHLAVTFAIFLALLCVAMLVYFIHHIANRINFDTVIDLVSRDMNALLESQTVSENPPAVPADAYWRGAAGVVEKRAGYLQQIDEEVLADWAASHGVAIRLKARVGSFVFPNAPLALLTRPVEDAEAALANTLVIGARPTAAGDAEFAVGQLVDVAVRALSPGVNDPKTAERVLNRLGAALCFLKGRHLCNGVVLREGQVRLQRDATDYGGLVDAMFHVIRQSAFGTPAILIHMLYVLRNVALAEGDRDRLAHIERHGELVRDDGMRGISNPADRRELGRRAEALRRAIAGEYHHPARTI